MAIAEDASLTDRLIDFLRDYYREDIGELAQRYPSEQKSLEVTYSDLFTADRDAAEDYLEKPEQMQQYLDEALRLYDLPADVDLGNAHVRVIGLPEERTFYPGHFSPTKHAGEQIAVRGEVVMASEVRPRVTEAAFECRRCGTMSYIPQSDDGFQEPHQCQGCERQGPFDIDHDQSEFVDSQGLRVQEPPSVAGGGGSDITVTVEDDLADVAEIGDTVIVPGTLHLKQRTQGQQKMPDFDSYLDASAVELIESDSRDLDISADERERIQALANGDEGDPLELAADSLSTKILGYQHIKKALVLAMVGGHRVTGGDEGTDRGNFHVLMLGDPGTAKSKMGSRAEEVAPRSVGISGKNASEAGITATAVRDELNDGQWTLDPGAFVKANGGLVWLDELDDMDPEVRASMLEPMSNQSINVNKAGINAKLSTQAAVVAAGNPKYGRFDPYEPIAQQFEFDSALLSRFDLIFTLSDQPDADEDADVINHMSKHRETAKRLEVDPDSVSEAEKEKAMPAIPNDLLSKWIALAKQQPAPITKDPEVRAEKEQAFAKLRAANGYDADSPVPVTYRKWEAVLRIAEAAAKFELSQWITERHFETAMSLIGRSLRDYGKDEDGNFDADVVEVGQSKKTVQHTKLVEEVLREEVGREETPREKVVELCRDRDPDVDEDNVHDAIEEHLGQGRAVEPTANETVRWLGRQ